MKVARFVQIPVTGLLLRRDESMGAESDHSLEDGSFDYFSRLRLTHGGVREDSMGGRG